MSLRCRCARPDALPVSPRDPLSLVRTSRGRGAHPDALPEAGSSASN